MSDGVFDEKVAGFYDAASAKMFEPAVLDPTVDVLAELAGDGRALEFAIGTGRVALPLRARGVEVDGIEMSQAMVDQMMSKPGAGSIQVTIGDMTTTVVDGAFRLVYLVYNTIGNLLTQDEQVRCFENASAHLEPGGCFVIEKTVPDVRRLPPGEKFVLFDMANGHVGIDEYDVVTQRLTSHHYWVDGERVERFQTPQRYVWPSELDLMARLAGLRLQHRWSSWSRAPFTSESTSHVSIWRKPKSEVS